MLQSADVAAYIRNSGFYGINANLESVDFPAIRKRVEDIVGFWRDKLYAAIKNTRTLDFYNHSAKFTGEKTIEVNGEKMRGNKIIIAVGGRPLIPDIPGIDTVKYLTNENILSLDNVPRSIAILGGGYIGMEFAHFFHSLGSKVTIIEPLPKTLANLEPSLCDAFNEYIAARMEIHTSARPEQIARAGEQIKIVCVKNGQQFEICADELLIAAGRTINTDALDCAKTGVSVDKRGFITADNYFQTANQDIWAIGDCIGTPAFRHIANYQVDILIKNLLFGKHIAPDYSIVPFAVFTHPEIASVGLNLAQASEKYKNAAARTLGYFGNAKGKAIGFKGFCKAVIDTDTDKILGFHIIGPSASILIHEILPIMTAGLGYSKIIETIHIHPALSELVQWTFTEGR